MHPKLKIENGTRGVLLDFEVKIIKKKQRNIKG